MTCLVVNRSERLNDTVVTKSVEKEIRISSKLRHPNIVQFLGLVIEDGYPLLISEWVENGTLNDYLEKNSDCHIGYVVR